MRKSSLVVSDASPLIHLAAINRLELVPNLVESVVLPPAVFEEITVQGRGKPGAKEIAEAAWVNVFACQNTNLLARFMAELDAGEAEALTLAVELKADAVLMDERLGRSVASRENIRTIGLLGLLIEAETGGLIQLVTPEMDALRRSGFYIANSIYHQIRSRCHE